MAKKEWELINVKYVIDRMLNNNFSERRIAIVLRTIKTEKNTKWKKSKYK